MSQTKIWRIFSLALGFGLSTTVIVFYGALYLSGGQLLIAPGITVLMAGVVGLLIGFSYYFFFKLALRLVAWPFFAQAQRLITHSRAPLPTLGRSNEIDTLETVLTEALVALERQDLFSTIATNILPPLDLPWTLERIVSRAVQTSSAADSGLILLLDEANQRYTVQASYLLPISDEQLKHISLAAKPEKPNWVLTQRRPFIIADVQGDERVHPALRQAGIQSLLSAPLVIGNQLAGLLQLFNWSQPDAFDQNDLWLANIYADLTVAAINNEPFYKEVEDERLIAAALVRLSKIVNSTLELNQVLNLTLEQLAQVITYDSASILLAEEMDLTIAACRGLANPDALVGHTFRVAENDINYQVMRDQRAWVIADVQQMAGWRHYYDDLAGTPTIRAWIGAPLVVQDQSIGLLAIEKYEPDFYTEKNGDMVAAFAAQIVTAVHNARLFDSLRHKALEVAVMADNLNEEKSKLDAILKNIADGLVVTDAEGTIMLVNPAFKDMFSWSGIPLVDHPLPQLEELQRLITNALEDPEATFMADIPLADGRIFKASSAAIREEARTLGVVTVLRDITHEKEVDRMKSEFISTVSHELRTPLTSVLGFAKHIRKIFKKNLTPKISSDDRKSQQTVQYINEELDIVISEGERLTRLINDVLDIAKMEAGKLEWHMADVSIGSVIHRAVAVTTSIARAKNLTVKINIERNLPLVRADQDRLIQVVTNLLSNAVKFTDAGEIKVQTLKWQRLADGTIVPSTFTLPETQHTAFRQPGHWLAVRVQDPGVGIAKENLPHVFEKFKQIGDTLTDRPKGTGLGLAICKEITEQHGGHIWVDSELGVGSTFTFVLPLAPEATFRPSMSGEIRRRVVDTLLAGKKGKLILVVDDEENIRNLLRQELSEAGYRIIEAPDGIEALTKARQEKPDLIILDVMMPGLNGFDVTSVLKGDQSTAHIPVLILSIVEDKEKGFRLGAEEYLTKPLDTDKLLQSIAALLARAERGEGHKKVLVIDQDAAVIETMTRVLQERGHEVVGAYDGQDGLQKARQERPDLIVLNTLTSPVIDYEVLKSLMHEANTRDARIIVLTATISPEEVVGILEQGPQEKIEVVE